MGKLTAQAPPIGPRARRGSRRLIARIWRDYLNPSRPGAGRETPSGRLIRVLLFLTAALSVVVTVGIVLVLIFEAIEFFGEVSLGDFSAPRPGPRCF